MTVIIIASIVTIITGIIITGNDGYDKDDDKDKN